MGQCFGIINRRRYDQRRNKRFEYTPKRSWKYHDDHMMSQFENFTWDSVGANRSGDEEEEEEDGRVEMLDSDEEIDTRQIRNSGRLMLDEKTKSAKDGRTAIVNREFEDTAEDSPGEVRPTVVLLPTHNPKEDELTLISHAVVT